MPRKPVKNSCSICGGPLDGRSVTATICGKAACVRERNRLKARKHGMEKLWGLPKECPSCGSTFKRSQERKKFCSDPCAKAGAKAAEAARERRKQLKLEGKS